MLHLLMIRKNNSNGKFVTTYRCISKPKLKSIVILVHERKKSNKCPICYLFDTVVIKKMTNMLLVQEKKKHSNAKFVTSIVFQNLIWKDMLNWFMRGRNQICYLFDTVVIKKMSNMLHVHEKKKAIQMQSLWFPLFFKT